MVVAADLESQREKYNIQKNISFVKVGSNKNESFQFYFQFNFFFCIGTVLADQKIEINYEDIGFCDFDNTKKSFSYIIDKKELEKILNDKCSETTNSNFLDYSLTKKYQKKFQVHDNCLESVVKNGETLKTGKYNFLVSFNCEKKELVNSKKNFNTIPKLEIKNDNCNLPNINRDIFGDVGGITGFGLGIGSITREKIDHLKKNLDWILYLYKDENIDQFIDYLAVQMKVNEKYSFAVP